MKRKIKTIQKIKNKKKNMKTKILIRIKRINMIKAFKMRRKNK